MSRNNVVHETCVGHNVFGIFLPFDVVVKIISHLDQLDCLRCTEVCRSWYSTIPQYAQSLWEKIQVSPKDKSVRELLKNTRWQQFLGDHVKHIVLKDFDNEQQLYHVIQKLIDFNCTEAEHLELSKCVTKKRNHKRYLSLLKQLFSQRHIDINAQQQQQLTVIAENPCNLPYLNLILEVCPQAYCSTFSLIGDSINNADDNDDSNDDSDIDNPLPIFLSPIPLNQVTHLTRLYFETTSGIKHGLVPILQRSPQLEFLSFGDVAGVGIANDSDNNTSSIVLDLKRLFIWCPKLIYLEINPNHFSAQYRGICIQQLIDTNFSSSSRKRVLTTKEEKRKGLRYFLVCEEDEFGPQQIGPFLQQHKDTLEFFAMTDFSSQGEDHSWVSVFENLHLPKLHTLHCDGTQYTDESIRSLVSRAPRLQNLTLDADHEIYLNLHKLLKSALQLRFLKLGQLYLHYHDERRQAQDEKYNDDLSQQQSSPAAELYQYLDLYGSQLCDIFFKYVIPMNDEILHAIAQLSRLQSLTIHFTVVNVYTDDGLVSFLRELQRTHIKTLKLLFLRELTIPMLSALANLQYLEAFETCGKLFLTLSIDGPELVKTLEKSTNLNYVHLQYLHLTNIDNYTYEDDEDRIINFLSEQVKTYTVTNWASSKTYYDVVLERKY